MVPRLPKLARMVFILNHPMKKYEKQAYFFILSNYIYHIIIY